jgi:hypothetical protein
MDYFLVYHRAKQRAILRNVLETPCESRDFESSKASFNNGFKLSVCSLARYKIACELIKFDHVMRTKSRPNHIFGHLILSFNK